MKGKHAEIGKKLLLIATDAVWVFLSLVVAYLITVKEPSFALWQPGWLAANIFCALAFLGALGLYSVVFSSVGILEAMKLVAGAVGLGAVNLIFALATDRAYIGMGTAGVFAVVFLALSGFTRFSKRFLTVARYYLSDRSDVRSVKKGGNGKKRIMLVGGGAAGVALIREMLTSDKINCKPVCIADDAPEKQGKCVYSVKVAGTTADVVELAKKYAVDEIFVTMPSASRKRLSEIVRQCRDCGCPVKILPGIYQLADGQVSVSRLRKVDVQDLLGRDPVSVDLDEIMGYIEKKTVLVTGGGGSIGSELCRQIAVHRPARLIILDIYENNAYDIEQELRRRHPDLDLLTLIASVRDTGKMRDVFEKYRPQIVFHAAAHKHVPLMETSPNEAVKNNVFGTLNVARCADEYGAETFVQISTDKAVNPTNVMGATKRICEMIVQTIGRHSAHTKFVAVRFGNVLGSNGSVIPLFRKQIEEGGPVTVTHKDIIRYFMTIPEAVSLVLQAGAYARDGQIFVLDMGEPMRIYDLASNLIKLSGLRPGEDIAIVCTGLRPGEKLFEERLMDEEGMQKTPNGLINIARPIALDEEFLWTTLDRLYDEAYKETDKMKDYVAQLVPTYKIDRRCAPDLSRPSAAETAEKGGEAAAEVAAAMSATVATAAENAVGRGQAAV